MKEVFHSIQQKFLQQVKGKLARQYSFADVLAADLNISLDSAYRRIRGDTILSFNELRTLCIKYGLSLDSIISGSHDTVLFNYRAVNPTRYSLDDYLSSIAENLATMNSFKVRELIYTAKDIPLFYLYMYSKLAAFKTFFWSKHIFKFPELQRKRFSFTDISHQTLSIGNKIWQQYLTIPSIEIWNEESVNVTLKQIKFYHDCDLFESQSLMKEVCDDLTMLIDHLEKMAENGVKIDRNGDVQDPECYFKLYSSEFILPDNTVFFQMDDVKVTHLGHNVLNILTSTDPMFCKDIQGAMNNVIDNSTLISMASEKVRNQFFNSMRKKVDLLINHAPSVT